MEAAIQIQDLARGVVQQAVGDSADGQRNVSGLSRAVLGQQAAGRSYVAPDLDPGLGSKRFAASSRPL